MSNKEFTNKQIERIDEVDNAVFDLCKLMTNNENLDWNIEFIGEIADLASEVLIGCGYTVYYPTRITYDDGREEIFDYYPDLSKEENNELQEQGKASSDDKTMQESSDHGCDS